ncbi:hypothetical protein [Pseudobacteroides cellulosolvens]|uniref:Holliday junction resolvase n=1 Tax=Pseudobacteroides cellulosolvens ATCC 35603 = DSM 2933 TaxID=398512 RepID=A0A0L6JG41_9FIRM|nr:hypothetical protein [Pseudobacteroides cellulosolvens]KNY24821.1 hypothetical protein Bccel_0078 [Pseudobacteroides cellulosolvens ATCC 35603 = DSM 2933]
MSFSQKDKQERGAKGEADITASLKKANLWNHKFINAGYGTVFDKLVIPPGGGYALEIKVREKPNIAYNKGSITLNERKGLTKFMNQVGQDHAFILGIWKTKEFERAFLIPWYMVKDEVCSGIRGSINMLDYPEVYKKDGVWDLYWFAKTKEA